MEGMRHSILLALGFDLPLAHDKPGVLLKPRVGFTRIAGGTFVEAGLGVAYYATSVHTIRNAGTGVGTSVTAGWEVEAGQNTLLKPQISYLIGAVGTLRTPDGARVATGWKQNLVLIEIRFQPR